MTSMIIFHCFSDSSCLIVKSQQNLVSDHHGYPVEMATPYLYPLDWNPDLSDRAGGDGEEHSHGEPGHPVQIQGQEELLGGQDPSGQREGN